MTAAASRRRFRFSLRSFLLAVSAVCIVLGVGGARVYRQRAILHHVAKLGGAWRYDDHGYYARRSPIMVPNSKASPYQVVKVVYPPPHEKNWLRKRVGDDWFAEVVAVDFIGRQFDDADLAAVVPQLAQLAKLRELRLRETSVTHEGIVVLSQLTGLRRLNLNSTPVRIDDPGMLELRRQLPELGISY
jgi:hypothetical protein